MATHLIDGACRLRRQALAEDLPFGALRCAQTICYFLISIWKVPSSGSSSTAPNITRGNTYPLLLPISAACRVTRYATPISECATRNGCRWLHAASHSAHDPSAVSCITAAVILQFVASPEESWTKAHSTSRAHRELMTKCSFVMRSG